MKYYVEYLNGILWNMKEYDFDGNIINELHEGNGVLTHKIIK